MEFVRPISRRSLLAGGAAAAGALLSGCSVLLPPGQAHGRAVTAWALTGGVPAELMPPAAAEFRRRTGQEVRIELFQNEPYKNKLWVAMGADAPPDLFFGWGGGTLRSFVDAGKVNDLNPTLEQHPQWRDRFLPALMEAATVNGKVYGVPFAGVQPVVLFYNKPIFEKLGMHAPRTWGELIAAVDELKAAGHLPISLGGIEPYTYLMWEEALVDRIGGSQVFHDVLAGNSGAWSHPAFLRTNRMLRDLVDRGGFGDSFASISDSLGQQTQLLTSGRAGMTLGLGTAYSQMADSAPDFVDSGQLGWVTFPMVEGGEGDPNAVVGNPSNYMSVTRTAQSEAAADFLRTGLTSDTYVSGMIERGEVPPINGVDDQLAEAKNSDWLLFIYNLARNATNYQLSWDQALQPGPAEALLIALQKLFLGQIEPHEFSSQMEQSPL